MKAEKQDMTAVEKKTKASHSSPSVICDLIAEETSFLPGTVTFCTAHPDCRDEMRDYFSAERKDILKIQVRPGTHFALAASRAKKRGTVAVAEAVLAQAAAEAAARRKER